MGIVLLEPGIERQNSRFSVLFGAARLKQLTHAEHPQHVVNLWNYMGALSSGGKAEKHSAAAFLTSTRFYF
jgi:hypothetical protein